MSTPNTNNITVGGMVRRGTATDGSAREIERLVAAAYWAGQSDARADERARLNSRVQALTFGRYHRQQRALVAALCPAHELRAAAGLSSERDEILAFDYNLTDDLTPYKS